jgi:hypothetical protein
MYGMSDPSMMMMQNPMSMMMCCCCCLAILAALGFGIYTWMNKDKTE